MHATQYPWGSPQLPLPQIKGGTGAYKSDQRPGKHEKAIKANKKNMIDV